MAGEGSMMLASALLKFNSRQQKHFIGNTQNTNPVYTSPIILKKVSKTEQLKLDQRVKELKHKEKVRLFLVSFLTFIICNVALIILVKSVLS